MIKELKKKPRVILVHGFASPFSGRWDIDTLRPYFEKAGYEVVEFNYGFRFFVSLNNDKFARKLVEQSQEGDIAIGHSNGCLVIQKASLAGAKFSKMVFIAPALDVDAEIGEYTKKIHVWYCSYDLATGISEFIPGHHWGPMGNKGYQGDDERFVNHDRLSSQYPFNTCGHLDMLYDKHKREYFVKQIIMELEIDEDCLPM